MSLTYLILAHDSPEHVNRIISSLKSEESKFFIHVDAKSKVNFAFLAKNPFVYLIRERCKVEWGGFSIVQAIVNSLRVIINETDSDHVILLSGTDYPIKNSSYIKAFFNKNHDFDFIEGKPFPSPKCTWLEGGRRRLECYALRLGPKEIATIEPHKIDLGNARQFAKVILKNPKRIFDSVRIWAKFPMRSHPNELNPFYGEMWWCLRMSTIKKILRYIETNPKYIEYHKETCIPDEIFFSTLVYNLIPENEIINSCLRLINWDLERQEKSPREVTLRDKKLIDCAVKNPNLIFVRKAITNDTCNYIERQIK